MELQPLIDYVEQVPIGMLLLAGMFGVLWLVGLMVVLRDTASSDRARIIQAYGTALPWRRRPLDSAPSTDGHTTGAASRAPSTHTMK